jgi:L-ectoine synthase
VFCVAGEGEIETVADGRKYAIRPGVMYALDRHDEHYLRARSELKLVCVFNPPLTGREVHDDEGVYPLVAETA